MGREEEGLVVADTDQKLKWVVRSKDRETENKTKKAGEEVDGSRSLYKAFKNMERFIFIHKIFRHDFIPHLILRTCFPLSKSLSRSTVLQDPIDARSTPKKRRSALNLPTYALNREKINFLTHFCRLLNPDAPKPVYVCSLFNFT